MFLHTINQSWNSAGRSIPATPEEVQADGQVSREVAVGIGASDLEVELDITVANLKSIIMVCDQDLTVETNSASVPAETISLVANVPYIWTENSYFANLLATNLTALFLTNGSGVAATFKLEALYDATP